MAVDVIGDVHGHADALVALLVELGYRERNGCWRHPQNTALFLGDLIDRGPRQLDAVDIPRRMRDAGVAEVLMGNHEFNAVAYWMPDRNVPGEHYRLRDERNRHGHAAFIEAVGGHDTALHDELASLFLTFPLWHSSPGLRAIHACWSDRDMAALTPHIDAFGRLTEEGFHATQMEGSRVYASAEILLKGPEMDLPAGVSFRDAQGIRRTRARIAWWDGEAATMEDACAEANLEGNRSAMGGGLPSDMRYQALDTRPLFFGHYWFRGAPRLLDAQVVCLDFSVAKGGLLCAYRHDGEPELERANLFAVSPSGDVFVPEDRPEPARP